MKGMERKKMNSCMERAQHGLAEQRLCYAYWCHSPVVAVFSFFFFLVVVVVVVVARTYIYVSSIFLSIYMASLLYMIILYSSPLIVVMRYD